MQGKEFIFMTNNDSTASDAIKGIKAPVISHGMNKFDSYDNIYFSPALNRQPMHTKMLNDLGRVHSKTQKPRIQITFCEEINWRCYVPPCLL